MTLDLFMECFISQMGFTKVAECSLVHKWLPAPRHTQPTSYSRCFMRLRVPDCQPVREEPRSWTGCSKGTCLAKIQQLGSFPAKTDRERNFVHGLLGSIRASKRAKYLDSQLSKLGTSKIRSMIWFPLLRDG